MRLIARLAHDRGYTQETLAELLQLAPSSIHRNFVERASERGKRHGTVARYCEKLGFSKLATRYLTGTLTPRDRRDAAARLAGALMRSHNISRSAIASYLDHRLLPKPRQERVDSYIRVTELLPDELGSLLAEIAELVGRVECLSDSEASDRVFDLVLAIRGLGVASSIATEYARMILQFMGDRGEVDARRLLATFEQSPYVRLAAGAQTVAERDQFRLPLTAKDLEETT